MALIGRIRKNFWFVLLVLGLALAAFVIMDMVNAGNRGGLGPEQIVGEVAGQKISYQDFNKVEQALYSNTGDALAAKSGVWNYLVEKAIIDKQSDAIGLHVSKDELMDLQFGSNLSPVIQQTFRNPQTGQIDMAQLLDIKNAIESDQELNPQFRLTWSEQEKQIKKQAKQDKLTSMISKAMFTPSFAVEASEKNTSSTVSFDYVKVPFDYIEEDVEITDADIKAYIDANKADFTNDNEQRTLVYAVKDVIPTSADSAVWRDQLAGVVTELGKKDSTQDSLYVVNNQGQVSPVYSTLEDLPEALQEQAKLMNTGDVYGPYLDNGAYFAVKLMDKRVYADSVVVRHLLKSAPNADPSLLEAGKVVLDSLEAVVRSRKGTIADMAEANSDDSGSKLDGGKLGPFAQASMISLDFSRKAFEADEGDIFQVTSSFGRHLVQVEDKIYNDRNPKYKFAFVRVPITPTEDTQDNLLDEVSDMLDEARDVAALEQAINGRSDMTLETAQPVEENDYIFATFGSDNTSRDIVKWAFDEDTEIGNVSPTVYTYTDKINYYNSKYVVAGLKAISAPGLADVATVRNTSELAIKNWKKGQQLTSQISGTDLNALASQYGTTVESSSNVKFGNVPGLGNEPKVLATAFAQADGTTSAPIQGNNGVYIVRTTSKNEGTAPASVPTARRSLTSQARSRAGFSLMTALKNMFKPEDQRSKFF